MIGVAPAAAQAGRESALPLKINEDFVQPIGYMITFRGSGDSSYGLPADTGSASGQARGGVLVRVERVQGQAAAYRIQVDSDGDGDVDEEAAQVAAVDSSVVVKVVRKWAGGKQRSLPYTIRYSRHTDRSNGQVREVFMWSPHYRAEGVLKVNNCESLFAVLDLNADGIFDKADSEAGTNITLDRNGDGKIWAADEWLKGEQIIEHCGDAFLVEGLESDGSLITLARTTLRIPKLGERLPTFSITTVGGESIRSDELKGKVHLLDFWATWCGPCVEKLPLLKRLGDEFKSDLTIIAVNVDAAPRMPLARQVIKDYGLPWPQVMKGEGERDPLWKMFGGMEGNHLNIPLYVLVDEQGVLRYAGNGGNDLSELRSSVKGLAKVR